MRIKRSFSNISAFAFALFFIIGITNSVDAQIRVRNNTSCALTVTVGQLDASTFTACDLCPINPPSAVNVPAGSVVAIFGQDVCGEQFGWLTWQVAGSATVGVSNNPGLASCVTNAVGAYCASFTPTNATWNSSGAGPVTVTIQ